MLHFCPYRGKHVHLSSIAIMIVCLLITIPIIHSVFHRFNASMISHSNITEISSLPHLSPFPLRIGGGVVALRGTQGSLCVGGRRSCLVDGDGGELHGGEIKGSTSSSSASAAWFANVKRVYGWNRKYVVRSFVGPNDLVKCRVFSFFSQPELLASCSGCSTLVSALGILGRCWKLKAKHHRFRKVPIQSCQTSKRFQDNDVMDMTGQRLFQTHPQSLGKVQVLEGVGRDWIGIEPVMEI